MHCTFISFLFPKLSSIQPTKYFQIFLLDDLVPAESWYKF